MNLHSRPKKSTPASSRPAVTSSPARLLANESPCVLGTLVVVLLGLILYLTLGAAPAAVPSSQALPVGAPVVSESLPSLALAPQQQPALQPLQPPPPPPPAPSAPAPLPSSSGPTPRSAQEASDWVAGHLFEQAAALPVLQECSVAPFDLAHGQVVCDAQCHAERLSLYNLNFRLSSHVDTRGLGRSVGLVGPTNGGPPARPALERAPLLQPPLEGAAALAALAAIQALMQLNSSALFQVGVGAAPPPLPPPAPGSPPTPPPTTPLPPALLHALRAAGIGWDSPYLAAALSSPPAALAAILAPHAPGSPAEAAWGPLRLSSAVLLEPGSAFSLAGEAGQAPSRSLQALRQLVCAWAPGWSLDVFQGAVHVYPPLRAYAQPPKRIPPALWAEYTMGGQVSVGGEYYNEQPPPGLVAAAAPRVYTQEKINAWLAKVGRREENYYGALDSCLYRLLDRHPGLLAGKRVAILGSLEPWYEVVALAFGAASVFTVEYGARASEDPRLSFVTPSTMLAMVAAGTWAPYDAALSISSFEHDGLGRYGDPLSGEGDLRAMREVQQHIVKPGGHLLLSVPVGGDCVVYNAHRVYGAKRLPVLLQGWAQLDSECLNEEASFAQWPCASMSQPALLLQNAE